MAARTQHPRPVSANCPWPFQAYMDTLSQPGRLPRARWQPRLPEPGWPSFSSLNRDTFRIPGAPPRPQRLARLAMAPHHGPVAPAGLLPVFGPVGLALLGRRISSGPACTPPTALLTRLSAALLPSPQLPPLFLWPGLSPGPGPTGPTKPAPSSSRALGRRRPQSPAPGILHGPASSKYGRSPCLQHTVPRNPWPQH